MCVSSDHGTIHVFILDNPDKNVKSSYVFFSIKNNIIFKKKPDAFSLAGATFLPKYFQSKWSSFKFDVNCTSKFICAFSQNNNQHSVIGMF